VSSFPYPFKCCGDYCRYNVKSVGALEMSVTSLEHTSGESIHQFSESLKYLVIQYRIRRWFTIVMISFVFPFIEKLFSKEEISRLKRHKAFTDILSGD
jgi:hypothetical protein